MRFYFFVSIVYGNASRGVLGGFLQAGGIKIERKMTDVVNFGGVCGEIVPKKVVRTLRILC